MSTTPRPTAFVLLSTHHGPLLVNRHDYLRLDNGAAGGVGWELFNHSCFESDEIDLMKRLLQSRRKHFGDGVVALDVGANIGVHTVELARCLHGWGEITSFEAQERVFYALAGNITLNNAFNARAVWAAVGEREGSIDIPVPDYLKPSSFGSFEIKPAQRHQYIGQDIDYAHGRKSTTRLVSLDGLALGRLDFVKIDVEGMEIEVLKGARQALQQLRPQLFVEIVKSDAGQILGLLQSLDYRFARVNGNVLAIHAQDPAAQELNLTA